MLIASVTHTFFENNMKKSKLFEWSLIEHEEHVIHTGEKPERIKTPDYAHLLPPEIAPFTTAGVYDNDENQHLSFIQGSGLGGSHPHLVHEFLSALAQNRQPYPNEMESANITCTGILAHESALRGGERLYLPEFTLL